MVSNLLEERRLEFDSLLRDIPGVKNVYYQPPENIKMSFPAIVYSRSIISNRFADNIIYRQRYEYKVTVIDKNPDSPIVNVMSNFPASRHTSHFTSNGYNHDVFNIIF